MQLRTADEYRRVVKLLEDARAQLRRDSEEMADEGEAPEEIARALAHTQKWIAMLAEEAADYERHTGKRGG